MSFPYWPWRLVHPYDWLYPSQILIEALNQYCSAQQSNKRWKNLLGINDPERTENMSWNSYISPVLAFKLITILSGTSSLEGANPQLAMSTGMVEKLIKLVGLQSLLIHMFSKPCRQRWSRKARGGQVSLKTLLQHVGMHHHIPPPVQRRWNHHLRKLFLRKLPPPWLKISAISLSLRSRGSLGTLFRIFNWLPHIWV